MQFSRRTQWEQHPNALNALQEELQAKGIHVVDLTQSNPTVCGFVYPSDIIQSLANTANVKYSPDSKGMLNARQDVAKFCQWDASRIVLTASTSESYSFLFRLLLNAGDKVLIPTPSYPLFQFLIELNDARYESYPLVYEQNVWTIDFEALEKLIDEDTKAIVLVNPNNPTSSYIKTDELHRLNKICQQHDLAIISDEVFFDYRLAHGSFESLKGNPDVLTFVLGGLSKSLALPQMKLGWILSSGPDDLVKEALMRLEIIADTFLSVNTPVQNACGGWLMHANDIQKQILARMQNNLKHLELSDIKMLTVEGGWYAVVMIATDNEEQFVLDLLRQDHVLVHPGYFFDMKEQGYVILSLITPEDIFIKGIKALRKRI